MEYSIGTKVFGDWQIIREIGEGSFGKVFEIQKTEYGVTTRSALKIIRVPKSQADIRAALSDGMDERSVTSYFMGFVEEIVKEIAIMSSLKSHPGIVSCEDHKVIEHAGEIGWDILIRMELLQSLTDYQLSHSMDEAAVRKMAIDLTSALAFCQKKALIHRDIKPENIFVSETEQFKLGDFGVARTAEKTTGGLSKKGTESYMAPEVYLARPYGATVDIYSLGLVLYKFMNHGRLPFLPAYPAPITFADRENSMVQRMQGVPVPPPAAASPEFAAIILKACAYNPEDRYRTAAEMLEALQSADSSVPAPQPIPQMAAAPKTVPSPVNEAEPERFTAEGTIGMWSSKPQSTDADDQGTIGMWHSVPSQTPSFSQEPSLQRTPIASPTSEPISQTPPVTPPVPALQPQKKTNHKLIWGCSAAAVALIVIFLVIFIGKNTEDSYTAQSNADAFAALDDFTENSSSVLADFLVEESVIEESSAWEEIPEQPILNLEDEALNWDTALTTMFVTSGEHTPANGLNIWSVDDTTPAELAETLSSYGFIFYHADDTYSSEPYYFDAVNLQTDTADLKYFVALPEQAYTLKCMRDAGKLYVVTDAAQSEIIFIKWGWDYENLAIETGISDDCFSQSMPWGTELSAWSAEDILQKSYFTSWSMHDWAADQSGYFTLSNFDMSYTVEDDPASDIDDICTLSLIPNDYYLYISGDSFARMDITQYGLTSRDQHHTLTILYDSNYEPTDYVLTNFWEPEDVDISDDNVQLEWNALIDSALMPLGTSLSSSGIDYGYASLSSLQSTLQANGFSVSEIVSDDTDLYIVATSGTATVAVKDIDVNTLDAESNAGASFRRFITFHYDPSASTASTDLATLQKVYPSVANLPKIGDTHHAALASLNIPQDLFYGMGQTLSASWWDGEDKNSPIHSFNTFSRYPLSHNPYEEDDYLQKDVLRRCSFSLGVQATTASSYDMDYYYGYFNNENEPTVYAVRYMIQE